MKKLFFLLLILTTQSAFSQNFQIDPVKFFTEKEILSAHTALSTDYLITEEKNVLLYCNLARMYPKKYAIFYKEYLKTRTYLLKEYQEKNQYFLSLEMELNAMQAEQPLYPDHAMFELAVCWADESGKTGVVGHDRVKCSYGYQGENCSYGYSAGLDIVMQLLIDNDIPSYGHRKAIFNPKFKGLGVAIRFHKKYTNVAVQDFSTTNDQLKIGDEAKEAVLNNLLKNWTEEERAQADVCSSLSYLNPKEKDIYFIVNLARLYPQRFKKHIWDNWSKFGPELVKGEEDYPAGYQEVSEFLATMYPREVYIPKQSLVNEARCLSSKWADKDKNYESCLTNEYSWKLDTFYPENSYKDKFYILSEPEGGNVLIISEGIITILPRELYSVKTILME